ncbi:MAG: DNA adenine methylase [Deltaproteobacteria bacterium]|nr:DNA adenine methylase [Deltaproteobacteria bacterium]
MIKYLGSKRLLVPLITELIGGLEEVREVVDLFSGTSRVGHALKERGYRVRSNDLNTYAATLARAYIAADAEDVVDEAARWLAHLSALPGEEGYFTETFCRQSRFFQPHNGARVDAIREAIARAALPAELEAVLLVSLMEAADRVDSTTGLQMAYLKGWAPRSFKDLALRMPQVLPRARHGKGEAWQLDAREAARRLTGDLVYLDPPYNQHKYLGNYHIWETLVRWDRPAHYGVACKREEVRSRHSPFNARRGILPALTEVIEQLDARHLLVSFSDEGWVSGEELLALLEPRGEVAVIARDHPRYVGARIGIFNPSGERVGEVGRLRNREQLFLVGPGAQQAARSVSGA